MGNKQRDTPPDGGDIIVVVTARGIDPLPIRVPADETLNWVCYLFEHEFGIASHHIVFIDEEGNNLPPMNHRLCYHGLLYQQSPRGWGYRFEAVIDE
ncbi:hypothetical protein FN846DRAFT_911213 [Sphaerosporella brunnea]|uniref:Uncharacterized protein n=1 Tax=Sphaerosporella brunnea TaxID=1250544 RepID=A0A5J5ELG4_9PEZI|nr:hypothetical protein FN846DRAFT_911213 [Sphaerosporella brunnea]